MNYKIRISKEYKRNYKKLTPNKKELVDSIVFCLSKNETLDKKYNDHKLKGNFNECRECHIKPDLLLVYKKQEDILVLTCINVGSHSEVFRLKSLNAAKKIN